VNIDVLLKAMEERILTPKRDPTKPPRMYVVRSFDVNKPGVPVEKLRGGVIGGTILQGAFKTKDAIEIRPGVRGKKDKKPSYEHLFTEVVSMQAGGKSVKEAKCGGLIGVGTLLDPSLTKADGLVGNLAGKPNMLPPTLTELTVDTHLFERAVGTKELIEVDRIRKGENLLLDVGTTITVGTVVSVKGDAATLQLGRAVCAEEGFRTAISRKIAGRWRLIGYGIISA